MRKIILSLLFSCFTAAVVFGNGPYPGGGGGGGGGTSTTNFPGILVTNIAYASNFVATATGQTNIFDVTLFTNGVTAWTAAMHTNTAAVNTSDNPTNSYTVSTIYTAPAQRCIVMGSAVLNVTANDYAGVIARYTNNGVGYALPMQVPKAAAAATALIPFSVILSPNATFKFELNNTGTATSYVTNVVVWRL